MLEEISRESITFLRVSYLNYHQLIIKAYLEINESAAMWYGQIKLSRAFWRLYSSTWSSKFRGVF